MATLKCVRLIDETIETLSFYQALISATEQKIAIFGIAYLNVRLLFSQIGISFII